MSNTFRHWVARYARRHAAGALAELRAAQWLTPERFEEERRLRLGAFLRRAAERVPYYREILDIPRLVDGAGRAEVAALEEVPPLTKELIRAHWADLQAEVEAGEAPRHGNHSGGSSGEPVRLTQNPRYAAFNSAVKTLMDEWSGLTPGEPVFKIWGSHRDNRRGGAGWRERLADWGRNTHLFDPLVLRSEDELAAQGEIFNRLRPVQLMGYADCVVDFVKVLEKRGLVRHRPRSVLTSAATLNPEMRAYLTGVLGCPVFNRYGSREVGDVACDCGQGAGLHVIEHTHLVELLDEDGCPIHQPGRPGAVVVTGLTNDVMPLIRYRIGDMASWAEGPCACGRPWRRLASLDGRVSDFVLTRDGRRVWAASIHVVFFNQFWIKRFQIVQEDYEDIRVKLELQPDHGLPAEALADQLAIARQRVEEMWSMPGQVRLEVVGRIEPSASGKYLHLVSRLNKSMIDLESPRNEEIR